MSYADARRDERRLRELSEMSTEEVAARRIRDGTSPRVRAVILAARKKVQEGGGSSSTDGTKKLKDGDVLLMRNPGTFMQNVISKATRSPYTHAAVYSDGKVFDALNSRGGKKNKGGNINTLKDFADRDKGITYDVFRPKDANAAREAARNVERITKQTKGYSQANAIQAGLRDRFGFGITTNYNKNYRICSELVYDAFNGLIGNDAGSSVSPGRLAKNKHLKKVHSLKLSIDELRS
jgi:hypothetical protein